MKSSKLKKVFSRLSEILELFSYFNLVPALIPLILFGAEEWKTSLYFIAQGMGLLLAALILRHIAGNEKQSEIPFHCNVVAIFFAWVLIPLFGSFVYFNYGLSPIDAVFESFSAWTTTGFSMFENVSSLPPQILFWRSFEQWLGGLGIVALAFFLLDQNTNIVSFSRTEGRTEFIKPTIKGTLKTILKIYIAITFIGAALLSFSGMDFFTALNISMTALPTGGEIPMDSLDVSIPQTLIIMVLIILGATPFFVHYKLSKGKFNILTEYTPLHVMLLMIVLVGILGIITEIDSIDSVFHAASAITNAGFAEMSLSTELGTYFYALIMLMLMGGCLGSTAGAIKIDRIIILIKGIKWKVEKTLSPANAIVIERFMNQTIRDEHVTNAALVLILHITFFVIASFIVNIEIDDLSNSMFEVASALGNVGLSTGVVSSVLNPFYKILFMFLMTIGRLEILTFFVFIGALLKK